MSKSVWRIELDYRAAISKAKELENIANDLSRNAYDKLVEVNDELNVAWEGDNRNAFITKTEEMKKNVSDSIKNLRKIADAIRRIAEVTRRAELEAERIARERAYGNGGGGGAW